MNITVTAVKNADGTHTVSWDSSVDTKTHTLHIQAWFGKKKSRSTRYFPLYVWAHWNPNNGELRQSGDITIDPALLDSTWQQANYEGYVCQFNNMDSPADQYNCIESATVQVKKK